MLLKLINLSNRFCDIYGTSDVNFCVPKFIKKVVVFGRTVSIHEFLHLLGSQRVTPVRDTAISSVHIFIPLAERTCYFKVVPT